MRKIAGVPAWHNELRQHRIMRLSSSSRDVICLAGGLAAVAAFIAGARAIGHQNPTTAALGFLLVILGASTLSRTWVAIVLAVCATLGLNFFFFPPVGTFRIADPENWIALVTFLAVGVIASQLSSAAEARAREAVEHRTAAELVRQRADLASALLASLSHDLRTPLTAIQVAVSNLRQHESEEERMQQAGIALRELGRLNRLFEDILDMARIDSNTITPMRQWVSPADIVDAALVHVGHALDAHDVQVIAEDATVVEVDPRLTSNALAHLVENAARYSGPRSRIQIRGRVDGDGLVISVTDSGPGLHPGEAERLFEPFFRGQSGRAKPGTGMGLAIARGLLAVEGGRIWGENADSGGARFSIAVPGRSRPAAAA